MSDEILKKGRRKFIGASLAAVSGAAVAQHLDDISCSIDYYVSRWSTAKDRSRFWI